VLAKICGRGRRRTAAGWRASSGGAWEPFILHNVDDGCVDLTRCRGAAEPRSRNPATRTMRQVTDGETPLAAAAARAPRCAGVYFLLDDDQELLYVGKAANLRARLAQHAAATPDRREPRLAGLYKRVTDVCWEELADEATAAAREADLIVSLRPPFNASHVAEGRWNFITITETRRDTLRFELTEVTGHHTQQRAYGCFPHLGRGVSSRPSIACSDGYTALLRLLWAASHDPASSYPSRITRSAPDRFQVGVEPDLRAGMHAFLSGTSDRLLDALMSVCASRRGAHLQPGLLRDRELATGFFTYGPQALRRLRLRHRRRAGPMPRHVIEQLLAQEMRSMTADIRLTARTDPRHDPLGRRAKRWTTPAVDARQAPDAARKPNLLAGTELLSVPQVEHQPTFPPDA
jgi:predicted GIY-YIG superfamily endonuclease